MNRLVKEHGVEELNLAVDITASNLVVTIGCPSWWVGPEIGPTLVLPGGVQLYVFDTEGAVHNHSTEGRLMLPPSTYDGEPVQLVGQLNYLKDNVTTPTREVETVKMSVDIPDTLWDSSAQENQERIEALEYRVNELTEATAAMKEAMIAALTTLAQLRNERN